MLAYIPYMDPMGMEKPQQTYDLSANFEELPPGPNPHAITRTFAQLGSCNSTGFVWPFDGLWLT